MKLTPENIHERLTTLGHEWATTNSSAEFLEETKRSILSHLVAESPESSMAAKESWAYRQEKYLDHIRRMVDARRESNIAKINLEAAKAWLDWKRTEAATERAVLKAAP